MAVVEGIADVGAADKSGGKAPVVDPGKPQSADPAQMVPEGKKDDKLGAGAEQPTRPDWLPETLWDADKGFKQSDFDALSALKAETDSRTASLPASPDKYELKLPPSFKLPEGVEPPKEGESLIDEADPRVIAAREFAHGRKMTQGEFEDLLAFGVNLDISEQTRLGDGVKAEREKLGGRAVERIKSVTSWLDAKLGAETAAALHGMMFTARQIEAFERLMQLNRGDVPGTPGAGRDAKPTEVSDEDWAKMSPVEKINYAREHSPAPTKKK